MSKGIARMRMFSSFRDSGAGWGGGRGAQGQHISISSQKHCGGLGVKHLKIDVILGNQNKSINKEQSTSNFPNCLPSQADAVPHPIASLEGGGGGNRIPPLGRGRLPHYLCLATAVGGVGRRNGISTYWDCVPPAQGTRERRRSVCKGGPFRSCSCRELWT